MPVVSASSACAVLGESRSSWDAKIEFPFLLKVQYAGTEMVPAIALANQAPHTTQKQPG
jgi:hypothetical protein